MARHDDNWLELHRRLQPKIAQLLRDLAALLGRPAWDPKELEQEAWGATSLILGTIRRGNCTCAAESWHPCTCRAHDRAHALDRCELEHSATVADLISAGVINTPTPLRGWHRSQQVEARIEVPGQRAPRQPLTAAHQRHPTLRSATRPVTEAIDGPWSHNDYHRFWQRQRDGQLVEVDWRDLVEEGPRLDREQLQRHYYGTLLTASLPSTGTETYFGEKSYETPCHAAVAARQTLVPEPAAGSGWDFWHLEEGAPLSDALKTFWERLLSAEDMDEFWRRHCRAQGRRGTLDQFLKKAACGGRVPQQARPASKAMLCQLLGLRSGEVLVCAAPVRLDLTATSTTKWALLAQRLLQPADGEQRAASLILDAGGNKLRHVLERLGKQRRPDRALAARVIDELNLLLANRQLVAAAIQAGVHRTDDRAIPAAVRAEVTRRLQFNSPLCEEQSETPFPSLYDTRWLNRRLLCVATGKLLASPPYRDGHGRQVRPETGCPMCRQRGRVSLVQPAFRIFAPESYQPVSACRCRICHHHWLISAEAGADTACPYCGDQPGAARQPVRVWVWSGRTQIYDPDWLDRFWRDADQQPADTDPADTDREGAA